MFIVKKMKKFQKQKSTAEDDFTSRLVIESNNLIPGQWGSFFYPGSLKNFHVF